MKVNLLEKLDHPGIVKIVGFGVFDENGLPFVAMEWLEGEDLAARAEARTADHSAGRRLDHARRRSAARRTPPV